VVLGAGVDQSTQRTQTLQCLGALNAVTKEVITLTNTGYINSHSVCALLQKLKTQTHPDLPISVVLDNTRYQRCVLVQNVAADLQIELLFLPTYSPNLNLIERVWKFVPHPAQSQRGWNHQEALPLRPLP